MKHDLLAYEKQRLANIKRNEEELKKLGIDTVTAQPTAKRAKGLANTPQPMVSGMNFQEKCWECKFGKHVKSNSHYGRCRDQRKHRCPDWRDDPRCTQEQLSLPGCTNKRNRQPSVRIDQAMTKTAKRALSFEEKAASSRNPQSFEAIPTVKELKAELTKLGLPTDGLKAVLQKRLDDHNPSEPQGPTEQELQDAKQTQADAEAAIQ